MITKLETHGNELAFIVDKSILKELGADASTDFEVLTHRDAILFVPIKNESGDLEFDQILDSIDQKYGNVLRRLAQ